jgi:hypothetical protein
MNRLIVLLLCGFSIAAVAGEEDQRWRRVGGCDLTVVNDLNGSPIANWLYISCSDTSAWMSLVDGFVYSANSDEEPVVESVAYKKSRLDRETGSQTLRRLIHDYKSGKLERESPKCWLHGRKGDPRAVIGCPEDGHAY